MSVIMTRLIASTDPIGAKHIIVIPSQVVIIQRVVLFVRVMMDSMEMVHIVKILMSVANGFIVVILNIVSPSEQHIYCILVF